jgi:hypothetical protein
MSGLPPEVLKVVEVLQRALGITEALKTDGPRLEWPEQGVFDPLTVPQRWDAGPISVTTTGYGPDPSSYSGGEQVWIVAIESVSFALKMYLHDHAGWETPVVLTNDPKNAPLLDALVTAGIRYREQ